MSFIQDEQEYSSGNDSDSKENAVTQPGAFVRALPPADSDADSESDEDEKDSDNSEAEKDSDSSEDDDDMMPIEKANKRLKRKQEKERYVNFFFLCFIIQKLKIFNFRN